MAAWQLSRAPAVSLGRSHAMLLASRGAKVVEGPGGGRDGEGNPSSEMANKVVEEIKAAGGEAVADAHGVDTAEGGEAIVKTALDAYGKVDICIANAGILRDRAFHNITEEDWDKIFAVHVKGSFNVVQPAFRIMRQNSYGRIIVTTSNAGLYGNFGQANYSSAKTAVLGFASTLELEGAKYNIKANVIAPVAASRLTEDVMPPAVLEALKPELCPRWSPTSAPRSAGLRQHLHRRRRLLRSRCHRRGQGRHLPNASIEDIRDSFSKITDMSGAEEFTNAFDEVSKRLTAGNGGDRSIAMTTKSALSPDIVGMHLAPTTFSYENRDVILYALGVGATELPFIYEGQLKTLPASPSSPPSPPSRACPPPSRSTS